MPPERGNVFEAVVPASPIFEIEKRDAAFVKLAGGIAGEDHCEPAGVPVWEGPQQNGPDDTEYCGIRADAQGQREDDDHAKARPLLDLTKGLAQIAAQVVEEHPPVITVPALLGSGDIAEGAAGSRIGIGRERGIADLVGFESEMRFDLLLEILEGSFLPPPHVQASDSFGLSTLG